MHAELDRLRAMEARLKVPKGECRMEFRVRAGTKLIIDGESKGQVQDQETWIMTVQKQTQKYTRIELVEE